MLAEFCYMAVCCLLKLGMQGPAVITEASWEGSTAKSRICINVETWYTMTCWARSARESPKIYQHIVSKPGLPSAPKVKLINLRSFKTTASKMAPSFFGPWKKVIGSNISLLDPGRTVTPVVSPSGPWRVPQDLARAALQIPAPRWQMPHRLGSPFFKISFWAITSSWLRWAFRAEPLQETLTESRSFDPDFDFVHFFSDFWMMLGPSTHCFCGFWSTNKLGKQMAIWCLEMMALALDLKVAVKEKISDHLRYKIPW